MICWFSERPLQVRRQVRDQAHDPQRASASCATCTTASTSTRCHRDETTGHARDERHGPGVACASPSRCSSTSTAATAPPGAFILIDEGTNETVGAGMILDAYRRLGAA